MDNPLLLDVDPESFDRSVNRSIAEGNQAFLLDALATLPELVEALRSSPDDWTDTDLAVENACAPLPFRCVADSRASCPPPSMPHCRLSTR